MSDAAEGADPAARVGDPLGMVETGALQAELTAARDRLSQTLRSLSEADEREAALVSERDHLAVALVAAEQDLARLSVRVRDFPLRLRLEQSLARVTQLESDLDNIRATVSWRVTKPLRRVRTMAGRFRR